MLNFDPSRIIQNKLVHREMKRLYLQRPLANPYSSISYPSTWNTLSVSLLNARSLRLHFQDILADPLTNLLDLLFFTEAHLYKNLVSTHVIPSLKCINLPQDANNNHHGLTCYYRDNLQCHLLPLSGIHHIEALKVELNDQQH